MKVDDDLTPMKVTVADEELRRVGLHSFKYLGAYFNSDASCVEEIKSRLAIGREHMPQLNTLWRSRAISNPLKAPLIQALIWPIAIYGSEAWTLNKELRGNIEAFEMQCYWRSMKVPYTEHVKTKQYSQKYKRNEDYSPVSSLTNWNTPVTLHATTHSPNTSCWAQCREKDAREARRSNG